MQPSHLTRYLTYQLYHALHLVFKITADGESADIHNFRIAIRRIRSLMHLYPDIPAVFPLLLKETVKQTNILRELDVLLSTLNPKNYPKTFKRLQMLRNEHFSSVITDTFKQNTIHAIQPYYDELCSLNPGIEPEQLIGITEQYYRQCEEEFAALPENATQKELHRLRIRFKNARYGLEFLNESSLADEATKIRACKRSQNFLGSIQDTFNQIKLLKKIYAQYPSEEITELIRTRKKKLKKLKKTKVSNQSA